jgi:hypothetical protein
MTIDSARFKKLCLALEGATEVPHVDRLAYRTTRKIFATLPPDGRTANLLLVPELQAAIIEAMPHAFSPVPGGWGRMGYTTVDLARVTEPELVRVLKEAHSLASEPKNKPSKTTAKPPKATAKPSKATAKPSKATAKPSKATAKPSKATAKRRP